VSGRFNGDGLLRPCGMAPCRIFCLGCSFICTLQHFRSSSKVEMIALSSRVNCKRVLIVTGEFHIERPSSLVACPLRSVAVSPSMKPAVPQAAVRPEMSVAVEEPLAAVQRKTHQRVRSPSHLPGRRGVGVWPFR